MKLDVVIYGCPTCGGFTLAQPESGEYVLYSNCGRDHAHPLGSTTLDVAEIETAGS